MTVWVVAGGAILIGTVLQRLSGTGVGLVCAPTLALLLGSAQGVLVTNATTTVSGLLIMLSVWREIDWRKAALLCVSAVPGALAGALLVQSLPAAWLQVVVGSVVLVGILVAVALPGLPEAGGRVWAVCAGVVGGLCNTTAGVAAPAMVIHARLSRWEQRSFAATLQPIFMTMGALSVVTKTLLGATRSGTPPWWFPLVVVVTVLVGVRLGGLAARRVSPGQARAMALVLATAGAVLAVARGLLTLA